MTKNLFTSTGHTNPAFSSPTVTRRRKLFEEKGFHSQVSPLSQDTETPGTRLCLLTDSPGEKLVNSKKLHSNGKIAKQDSYSPKSEPLSEIKDRDVLEVKLNKIFKKKSKLSLSKFAKSSSSSTSTSSSQGFLDLSFSDSGVFVKADCNSTSVDHQIDISGESENIKPILGSQTELSIPDLGLDPRSTNMSQVQNHSKSGTCEQMSVSTRTPVVKKSSTQCEDNHEFPIDFSLNNQEARKSPEMQLFDGDDIFA